MKNDDSVIRPVVAQREYVIAAGWEYDEVSPADLRHFFTHPNGRSVQLKSEFKSRC